MSDPEPPSDLELAAYVDGQLDPQRRFEVEDRLASDPFAAARVMGDLRTRDALRLLAAQQVLSPEPRLEAAMARLLSSLRRVGRLRVAARVAAVAALVLAGGVIGRLVPATGEGDRQAASEFVAEAVMAHRTSLARAAMSSQPESRDYDPSEIRTVTRIVLPDLPDSWRIRDVQVYPSDDGPTVAMALVAPGVGAVSLFAARSPDFTDRDPTVVRSENGSVAYWQIGELAYALTGRDPESLEAAAKGLSRSQQAASAPFALLPVAARF